MQHDTNTTDYAKAKEIVSTLGKLKSITITVDNVKSFRKYLNDFTRNTGKEFTTKTDADKLRVIRLN